MRGYVSGAAQRVYGDHTWWWRALVLAGVSLVPYVGAFLVVGYYMILMRDAAWGLERGLPRFQFREIVRRAWDGFIVGLVWGLALAIPLIVFVIAWAVSRISEAGLGVTPDTGVPWWILVAVTLAAGALAVLVNVATLRTALYLKPSAGLSLKGVLGLIKRDPAGFREVSGLAIAVFVIASVFVAPTIYLHYLVSMSPLATFALRYGWGLVAGALSAAMQLVVFTAYGLWAKDTDPSSWPPLRDVPPSRQPYGVAVPGQDSPASIRGDDDEGPFSTGD